MKKAKKFFAYLFGMQSHILVLYQLSRYCRLRVPVVGLPLALLFRHIIRVYSSCDISPLAIIDSTVRFPHPLGIVIGDGVVIAENVMIWQHVTLGSHGKSGHSMTYPKISRDVRIYANTSVIGPVKIGQGAVIGAHSLVLADVPAGATAAGTPARIVKFGK